MVSTDEVDGLLVLGLQKSEDQFVFLFDDSDESHSALWRAMAIWAADPELDFNWFDVGRLIAKVM